jgi:hypothetical protein
MPLYWAIRSSWCIDWLFVLLLLLPPGVFSLNGDHEFAVAYSSGED